MCATVTSPRRPYKGRGVSKSDRAVRTDLGLELAMLHSSYGVPMTHRQLAAWTGLSWQAIFLIEHRALRRIRWSPRCRGLQEVRS